MTSLRILNLIVWAVMAAVMAKGAWAQATGRKVRHGDPMRLACFATAVVMIGFVLRWLIAEDSIIVFKLLYVLSAAVGCYIIRLAFHYGRGPLL